MHQEELGHILELGLWVMPLNDMSALCYLMCLHSRLDLTLGTPKPHSTCTSGQFSSYLESLIPLAIAKVAGVFTLPSVKLGKHSDSIRDILASAPGVLTRSKLKLPRQRTVSSLCLFHRHWEGHLLLGSPQPLVYLNPCWMAPLSHLSWMTLIIRGSLQLLGGG